MVAGRWLALAACGLAVVLVAGCTAPIVGDPRSRPGAVLDNRPGDPAGSKPEPSTGLGNVATLDPCSLTDPEVFAPFGAASFGVPDSLDDCLIEIRTPASEASKAAEGAEPVRLSVGALDRVEALPDINTKPSVALAAGIRVVYYATAPSYCDQVLVLADGVTLSVNAAQYTGSEPRLCDMVTAGMERAVRVFALGPVRHRAFAANSLGTLDPCPLVPATTLAQVPGIGAAAPKTYPAKHDCAWTGPDNTRLRVMFTVGAPPRTAAGGASETRIAGRSSVLSPTPDAGDYSFCGVRAGHIPFTAKDHTGLVEIAAVFVRMPKGRVDAACRAATEVANAVWPKLPQA